MACAALRTRIAEEIAAQGGHPLAQRTLQLLTEAVAEPQDAPPGYRILDRAGHPRRGPAGPSEGTGKAGPEPTVDSEPAMTLADFVADLRRLHPALFVPSVPEAASEVGPVGESATPAPVAPGAAARFVEARSTQARRALARSATRGRALAGQATERWQGLRRRFAAPLAATSTESALPSTETATRPGGLGAFARQAAGRARGGFADTGARLHGTMREGGVLRDRRVLAAGAGLLGLVVLIAVAQRSGEDTQTPSPPPVSDAAPSATETVPPAVSEAAKPVGERAADALTGPVEVIDTATLRVAGKLVRLFGVEWVRGGQADELTRYLAGRTVTCQPVAGSEARLCNVDGRDLSEVVLFNGGGRASSEATPDLVAAEDRARTERLGVWAR
ncbi:hypothetical protein ASF25_09940 [Methylobacterium sp. Leaf100]|nr:hypothetical protein ASF25_09940 [Methylobacterium sp. Leaf100]